MLYYGRLKNLDRFGQLVVRPEDKTYLYQTPGVTCEEIQPFVRSEIELAEASTLGWPFSLYVFVRQPDGPTLNMWEYWYMPREKIFGSS
jgi:hypothetical protein